MPASLLHSIDLNFKNVNRKPYRPTLSCLNRIGPFEVSLMARAISANRGQQRIRAARLPTTSINLFTALFADFCENDTKCRAFSMPPNKVRLSCGTAERREYF